MTITRKDIYWQGPGWYVELVIDDREDRTAERREYRFLAPYESRVADLQEMIKAYEKPPHYFQPRVKRWRDVPTLDALTTLHQVEAAD